MKFLTMLYVFTGTRALRLAPLAPTTLAKEGGGGEKCRKQPFEATECGPNTRFSFDEMRARLGDFKDVWARHPGGGKLSLNHQFAEWFLVKTLKPSVIIESGVLHGQSTWGLREAAGPEATIFSFDPVDQTKLGWRDSNPNTKYITGGNWKDLAVIDWDALGLSKEERGNAVVILDDHQVFFDRMKTLKELGFRHVFVEDNNAYGFGNSSPNFMCTNPEIYKNATYTPGTYHIPEFIYANSLTNSAKRSDNAGVLRKVTLEEHSKNVKWVSSNLKSYFEFPAIVDPCGRRPSLIKHEELTTYGLGGSLDHRYPPYMEIIQ